MRPMVFPVVKTAKKEFHRATVVEQNMTINEEMNKVLDDLDTAEPQVMPQDEQQVSGFFI